MSLEVYLQDPGRVPGIGPEKGRKPAGDGVAKYVSPHGSYRYVAYVGGQPVSALQVVSQDRKNAIIANVFTAPEARKQGWASKLLQQARRDFKTVEHAREEHISDEGKAWREKVHGASLAQRVVARFLRATQFAYHGIRSAVLPHIQEHGLIPGAVPSYSDRYSEYDDGQHLFFSDDPGYIRGAYGDTILRFPWPHDTKPDKNTYGRLLAHQFVTKEKVSPGLIEVETEKAWEPLKQYEGRA